MTKPTDSIVQRDPSCADDYDPMSISVDDARVQIRDDIAPIVVKEKLSIRDSLNRILAADITSPSEVPAYTNSAMDGYAVNGDGIADQAPATYEIIGTAFAGKPFTETCRQNQTVRIMTGAVIPDGCDTVIMQEHVETISNAQIKIGEGHQQYQNIRRAGEDIAKGDVVMAAGQRLAPADLGVLASLGISEVPVYRRPRVAFFSTGDELRSVGEPLKKGDIYDSNRYTLFAMLKQLNVDILDMGVIRDDEDALRKAFQSAASMADVIITSGGVSVGEADYIKPILAELGQTRFWKIGMKPGRPLTFGKVNGAYFFGLPGNPVSVMVTFYQFVQPAINYLASGTFKLPITIKATCTSQLRKRPGRFEFQRGVYQQSDNGEITVTKTGHQSSGVLSSMSMANCFILLSVESTGTEPGETVDIQPFHGFV